MDGISMETVTTKEQSNSINKSCCTCFRLDVVLMTNDNFFLYHDYNKPPSCLNYYFIRYCLTLYYSVAESISRFLDKTLFSFQGEEPFMDMLLLKNLELVPLQEMNIHDMTHSSPSILLYLLET